MERAGLPDEAQGGPKRFPYSDGQEAAQYLILRMPPDEFSRMLGLLNHHKASQTEPSTTI